MGWRVLKGKKGIVAIAGVDTRRLTRILRAKGSLSGCIIAGSAATDSDIENKR
ncbi:MAG: hypothetical protein Ct9H90mP27_5050 [Gammaproteobacteria bacterium]|nr:MAG: hypothetical protein Ct9H90mP27_5050 [Gammaproteobacteria bacterium]